MTGVTAETGVVPGVAEARGADGAQRAGGAREVAEAGRGQGPGGWRRWRGPAVVIAIILLGGIVVGLAQPTGGTNGYLDPGDARPGGAHALAQLLSNRGASITRVSSAPAPLAPGRGPAPPGGAPVA